MSEFIKRETERMAQRQFEAMAHSFFIKWQPSDPHDSAQFSAELFSLVRQIYIDACEPQTRLMTELLSCMPPVFPKVTP